MDRLDELTVLVTVLEAGSLAAASRRLRRSPPSITRALAALEDRVGARLVERTTRHLTATEAGRTLAGQARAVLAGYAEAVRDASEAPLRGTLRVTAPVVFGRRHVTPLVATFLDAQPTVTVDLVLADRNLDLVEEGLDAAVRIGPLADSSLVARRVGEVRRVLVASPEYLAARGTPRKPGDLAGHDAIFSASRPMPIEWRFGRARAAGSSALRPGCWSTRWKRRWWARAWAGASPWRCRIRWRTTSRPGPWCGCCPGTSRRHCRFNLWSPAAGTWRYGCARSWTTRPGISAG